MDLDLLAVEIAHALAKADRYRYASQIYPFEPISKTHHIGVTLAPWLKRKIEEEIANALDKS